MVPAPQLGVVLEHLQAAFGVRVDLVGDQEVAVGAAMRPSDAPTELVELGQPEVVGPAHEHRVGVRHVEPALHDHRRDEDIHLPADEPPHRLLEGALAHLPMADRDAGTRHEPAQVVGHRLDRVDAVVHEEDLSAAVKFAGDPLLDEGVVPWLDERQHR